MHPIDPSARRPLKSRDVPFFRQLARVLATRGVSANAISLASMVFAIAAGAMLAATGYFESSALRGCSLAAAVMIQLRLLCNMIDGLVAVECGRKTATGELWNEAPDRVSDVCILVGAGYAIGGMPVLGFTAALLALLTAYIRALGASVGAGQVFAGPGAKPQRMAMCTVASLIVAVAPATPHLWTVALGVIIVASALTCIIRLRKIAAHLQTTAI